MDKRVGFVSAALVGTLGACSSGPAKLEPSPVWHGAAARQTLASAMIASEWRPIALHDATGRASLADTRCTADIGFTHDGYVLGYDTVNPIQSRYRLTSSGYKAGIPAIGGVGFLGHGLRLRLIGAIDSMFEGGITANVNEDRLVLTSPTATLVLHRNGAQPDFASSPRTNPHVKRGC